MCRLRWREGKPQGFGAGVTFASRQGTPLAKLHLTLLDKLGIPIEQFGDSTGKLENIADAGLANI